MVEPGRRCLGDRYELRSLIAAGGMGQVWRGRDVLLGRSVAVKVLRSEYTGDPTFVARFRGEAQHAASLSHPNIAAVFDYGEVPADGGSGESLAYLVMELVEGEPLSAVLLREGPLEHGRALALLRQTASALGQAHRVGMVHRDVKPGNILVRGDGSVKITDFGIAWSAGSVPLTRTGQVIGTPQYLSPEQAEGFQATPASDVYALGLVGYECLTGRSAFSGDNAVTVALKQLREQPRPLPAELPAGVRELILRALAKDPAGRFRDGTAFLAAIDDVASGRPLSGSSVPRAIPLPPAAGAGWAGGSAPDARESFPTVGPPTLGPPTVAAAVGPATGRSARTPPGRLRPRLGRAVLPAVALLAGAGIAAAVVPRMVAAPAPAGNAVVAAPTQPAGYVLVPGDYVGRPVEEVAIQLAALGLSPQRRPQATDDAPPGTVTAVSPTGVAVHPGDAVVLTYAVAGSGAGDGPADGSGPSSGTGLVPAAQTSVAPRPVPGPAPGPAGGSSLPAAASTSSEGAVAAASVAPQSPNDAAPTSSATATPSASGTSSPAATSSATSTPTLPRPSSASPSGSSTG